MAACVRLFMSGEARVSEDLRERERREGRVLGGLEHDRVAARQRGSGLPRAALSIKAVFALILVLNPSCILNFY